MTTCSACGKHFLTSFTEGNIFCSVGCQISNDPIEPIQRPVSRSRPARTARGKVRQVAEIE